MAECLAACLTAQEEQIRRLTQEISQLRDGLSGDVDIVGVSPLLETLRSDNEKLRYRLVHLRKSLQAEPGHLRKGLQAEPGHLRRGLQANQQAKITTASKKVSRSDRERSLGSEKVAKEEKAKQLPQSCIINGPPSGGWGVGRGCLQK